MTTSVLQLQNRPPTPRPSGPKHDNLHMQEGLRHCWCMCGRCFLKYSGDTGGVCICRDCPCQGYYNSRSPMYVRSTPGGNDAR